MVYDSWLAAVRESNHKSQIVNSKSKSQAGYSDPMGVAGGVKKREEAVQGRGRYARARRRSSIPTTSRALAKFSGGGSWAEPPLKTAHRRIPAEGVALEAPPS